MKNMINIQSVIGTIAFALIPPQALAQNHYRPVQQAQQSAPRPAPSSNTHASSSNSSSHEQSTPAPTRTAPPAHETPAPSPATNHSNAAPPPTHNSAPAQPSHASAPAPMHPAPQTATNRPAPAETHVKETHFNASHSNETHTAAARPAASFRPAQRAPRAEVRRADGARVVVVGRSHGFVERPIAARPGFYARTYVVGGRSFVRVYREERFHGFAYHAFIPRLYFAPAFYGWAYDPWAAPVYFSWGWNTAPWYGYYGVYFRPAPVYTTSALWLTDFLLAENLKQAYENQQQSGQVANASPAEPATLTPEVRALIAEEVRRQIDAERAQATSGDAQTTSNEAPPALDPNSRVVVVSTDLDVPMQNGSTCRLTPGDILYRTSDTVGDDGQIGVTILSSKPGSCAANSATSIDLSTLQDMHNDFRQQIGSGLAVLAQNQGKGGLPAGPAAAPRLASAGDAQVDTDAASALMAQEQAASLNKR